MSNKSKVSVFAIVLLMLAAVSPQSVLAGGVYQGATVVKEIPTAIFSRELAITSDDAFVWFTDDNMVSLIDTSLDAIVATVPVQIVAGGGLDLTPDDKFLYVAGGDYDIVSVIDTGTRQVVETISVGSRAQEVLIDSSGTYAYVANGFGNSVSVIEISMNTVIKTIGVGVYPEGMAITPDGAYVLVVNCWSDTVSVISTLDHTVVQTIPVGDNPDGIAIWGEHAYVTVAYEDMVSVIDLSTFSVVATIGVGDFPDMGIGLSPDGRYVFVGNYLGRSMTVIDTLDEYSIVDTIDLGATVWHLVLTAEGDKIYASCNDRVLVISVTYATPTVPATIDLQPDTLNLKSKGKWVTAYIELPGGYDVARIDTGTVILGGTIPAETHPTEVDDYDSDGIADLMVKFDRQALVKYLGGTTGEVALTVSGEFTDGAPFEGSDTITVINPGK